MDNKPVTAVVQNKRHSGNLPPVNASRCGAIYWAPKCLADEFLLAVNGASSISAFGLLLFVSSLAWTDDRLSHQAHCPHRSSKCGTQEAFYHCRTQLLCQMEAAHSVWEDPSDPALVWMADVKPFAEYYFWKEDLISLAILFLYCLFINPLHDKTLIKAFISKQGFSVSWWFLFYELPLGKNMWFVVLSDLDINHLYLVYWRSATAYVNIDLGSRTLCSVYLETMKFGFSSFSIHWKCVSARLKK